VGADEVGGGVVAKVPVVLVFRDEMSPIELLSRAELYRSIHSTIAISVSVRVGRPGSGEDRVL